MNNFIFLRALKHAEHTVFCVEDGQKTYYDPQFNKRVPYSSGQQVKRSILQQIADNMGVHTAPITFNYNISKSGELISTYDSATIAGNLVGVDSSCIIKVCKGKRKSAGGYIWKYANQQASTVQWEDAVQSNDWLGIAEIVTRTCRDRNVIYYHIKKHGVPIVLNGRMRLIYLPALEKILK